MDVCFLKWFFAGWVFALVFAWVFALKFAGYNDDPTQ
jgi:hypothetical protein